MAGLFPQRKQRVGMVAAVAMLSIAFLIDALQFLLAFLNAIPVVGTAIGMLTSWFLSLLAAVIFSIWFRICGVSYFDGVNAGKKVLVTLGSVIAEAMPLIPLPGVTVGVLLVIILTRWEDAQPHAPKLPKLRR